MMVHWLRSLLRTENKDRSSGNPDIYVFGVKHSDSTLVDSIPDTLPEDVGAVYHEHAREEMPSIREAFWASPFYISFIVCVGVIRAAQRQRRHGSPKETACQKASQQVAEQQGTTVVPVNRPTANYLLDQSILWTGASWLLFLFTIWLTIGAVQAGEPSLLSAPMVFFGVGGGIFAVLFTRSVRSQRDVYIADTVLGEEAMRGEGTPACLITGRRHLHGVSEHLREEGLECSANDMVK